MFWRVHLCYTFKYRDLLPLGGLMNFFKSVIASLAIVCLLVAVGSNNFFSVRNSYATSLGLPEPNSILHLSKEYQLPIIRGLRFSSDSPYGLTFIFDEGSSKMQKTDMAKSIEYFMAALTLSESDLWVNLSPYEKDRICADALADTELGKAMLAQDYVLKQLSSSLTDPDTKIGQAYWDSDQAKNSLSKIWIEPDRIELYKNDGLVYINKATLKTNDRLLSAEESSDWYNATKELIDKEINNGKNFAPLRQLYNSLILAVWFKNNVSNAFVEDYADQGLMGHIDLEDKKTREKIYNLYTQSYSEGVYNKLLSKDKIKKKYFSGGEKFVDVISKMSYSEKLERGSSSLKEANIIFSKEKTKIFSSAVSKDPNGLLARVKIWKIIQDVNKGKNFNLLDQLNDYDWNKRKSYYVNNVLPLLFKASEHFVFGNEFFGFESIFYFDWADRQTIFKEQVLPFFTETFGQLSTREKDKNKLRLLRNVNMAKADKSLYAYSLSFRIKKLDNLFGTSTSREEVLSAYDDLSKVDWSIYPRILSEELLPVLNKHMLNGVPNENYVNFIKKINWQNIVDIYLEKVVPQLKEMLRPGQESFDLFLNQILAVDYDNESQNKLIEMFEVAPKADLKTALQEYSLPHESLDINNADSDSNSFTSEEGYKEDSASESPDIVGYVAEQSDISDWDERTYIEKGYGLSRDALSFEEIIDILFCNIKFTKLHYNSDGRGYYNSSEVNEQENKFAYYEQELKWLVEQQYDSTEIVDVLLSWYDKAYAGYQSFPMIRVLDIILNVDWNDKPVSREYLVKEVNIRSSDFKPVFAHGWEATDHFYYEGVRKKLDATIEKIGLSSSAVYGGIDFAAIVSHTGTSYNKSIELRYDEGYVYKIGLMKDFVYSD